MSRRRDFGFRISDFAFCGSAQRCRTQKTLRCALFIALALLLPASPASAAEEAPSDAEQVRQEFDQIFAQPEFRRLRHGVPQKAENAAPDWLDRFVEWLKSLFDREGSSGLGALWQVLAYTALAVLVSLVIWLIVRAVNSWRHVESEKQVGARRALEGEAALPPGDLSADEYQRRAEELAARGAYREAVGQLILGAMSRIERAGLIRFRHGLTHRDYLRALRGRVAPQQAFRTQVAVYEPICFGRRPADEEHYRAAFEAYRAGFGDGTAIQTT